MDQLLRSRSPENAYDARILRQRREDDKREDMRRYLREEETHRLNNSWYSKQSPASGSSTSPRPYGVMSDIHGEPPGMRRSYDQPQTVRSSPSKRSPATQASFSIHAIDEAATRPSDSFNDRLSRGWSASPKRDQVQDPARGLAENCAVTQKFGDDPAGFSSDNLPGYAHRANSYSASDPNSHGNNMEHRVDVRSYSRVEPSASDNPHRWGELQQKPSHHVSDSTRGERVVLRNKTNRGETNWSRDVASTGGEYASFGQPKKPQGPQNLAKLRKEREFRGIQVMGLLDPALSRQLSSQADPTRIDEDDRKDVDLEQLQAEIVMKEEAARKRRLAEVEREIEHVHRTIAEAQDMFRKEDEIRLQKQREEMRFIQESERLSRDARDRIRRQEATTEEIVKIEREERELRRLREIQSRKDEIERRIQKSSADVGIDAMVGIMDAYSSNSPLHEAIRRLLLAHSEELDDVAPIVQDILREPEFAGSPWS